MKSIIVFFLIVIGVLPGCRSYRATSGDDEDVFGAVLNITQKEFVESLRLYPVNDLMVLGSGVSEVTLSWTAPGGNIYKYDIRYSREKITESNWQNAIIAPDIQWPRAAPSLETFSIGELQAGITYYFGIKGTDEQGNYSSLSNIVSYTTNTNASYGSDTFTISGNLYLSDGSTAVSNGYSVKAKIQRTGVESITELSSSNGAFAIVFKSSEGSKSVYGFDLISLEIYDKENKKHAAELINVSVPGFYRSNPPDVSSAIVYPPYIQSNGMTVSVKLL